MNRKIAILLTLIVILAAVLAGTASASEERTDHQRIAALEARVAALEACNPIACTLPVDSPPLGLPATVPSTAATPLPTQIIITTSAPTVAPTIVTTVPPPVVTTVAPTATQAPSVTPTTHSKKPPCNQGVPHKENCDPGNSNNHNPSNDEGPRNRGGKAVP